MTSHLQALMARVSLRLHGDAPDGERMPVRVTPRDGTPAYDVDVIFDRQHVDRTMLGLSIQDASPKMWTLSTERAIVENQDLVERAGSRWHATARFEREDGWTEYLLTKAPTDTRPGTGLSNP